MIEEIKVMGSWFVYILECGDGSYYTGITCDLARRVAEHKSGKGARYTRIKGVKELLWSMSCDNRSVASKLEIKIKAFSKSEKRLLVLKPDHYNTLQNIDKGIRCTDSLP